MTELDAALAFHTLDVFTDRPFAGNPLAVVLGADGLTPDQMQTIAAEFNLSETIFVQAPRDPAHTARVRIFLPRAEIPFAGHPIVGCAILLATLNAAADGTDFTRQLVLEAEAGPVPVTVTRRAGRIEAEFTAPLLPQPGSGRVDAALLAPALGLEMSQIGFGAHRPAIWQAGPGFLYVPVASLAALGQARVIRPHWDGLMAAAGLTGAFLYTPGSDCDFRTRMFAPDAGIPEDPATGSASAALSGALQAAGALDQDEQHVHLRQGVEMGRASDLFLTIRREAGQLAQIRLRGTAVGISTGRIVRPAT